MHETSIALACAALLALTTAAQAQPTAAPPAATAAPPAGTAPPETTAPAKAKPKPRAPQAARALTIVNAGTSTIAKVEVTGESKTVTWNKPLAAKAKAVVKLPPQKACTVSVVATVEGEGAGAPGEVDICKEKQVRLTD